MGSGSSGLSGIRGSGGLLSKIDQMGDENEVDNLLPMSPSDVLRNGGRVALRQMRNSGTPIVYHNEEVNISDLETEQATVFKEVLRPIAQNVHGEISGWNAIENPTSRTDTGIRAVRYNGHLTIVDGNNRVNVAILNGQKRIKIRVVDI